LARELADELSKASTSLWFMDRLSAHASTAH
jgi:hypothetical protein